MADPTYEELLRCWMKSVPPADRCILYDPEVYSGPERPLLVVRNGDFMILKGGTKVPMHTEFALCSWHSDKVRENDRSTQSEP